MGPAVPPESLSVRDVTIDYVKPQTAGAKREFEVLRMTFIDVMLKNTMSPSLFAYRSDNNGDASEQIERLKTSLSKTLDLYYPAAGRYVYEPGSESSGPGFGRPQIICNDAGVPFIQAYADRFLDDVLPVGEALELRHFQVSRISELYERGQDLFEATVEPPNPGIEPFNRDLPKDGLPPLVIQVTRFKCGGVVMAFVYPHMLMDAASFAHFMKAWSDISTSGDTSIVPDLHRELSHDYESLFRDVKLPPPVEMRPKAGQFVKRIFEVKRSVIDSLKQEVQKETNSTRYVSTIDCISAHFWQALIRLTCSSPTSELTGRFSVVCGVAEGRSTGKDRPLPRYLWANMISRFMYPKSFADELLKTSLSSAALKARDFMKSCNTPEGWNNIPMARDCHFTMLYDKSCSSWLITSLASFPLYDTEFDLLGKPSFVCPTTFGNFFEGDWGRAVMYPPLPHHRHKSSATAHLEINPRYLDTLSSDPQFMSLFLDTDHQLH